MYIYGPWNPLQIICISALCIFWKWQTLPTLITHSVTYSKFIFRRGYPNKMIPTINYELILNDYYGSGRCCNRFQTHQTLTKNTKVGTLRSVQVAVEKITITTFLFQCYVFCISFIVFMHVDLSVLWQVLDCSMGLTCVALSSAANAQNARTEERTV